jgi:colicin import membrane protein
MATKTKTAPASRSTRSRAQVQQEFAAIRQETEAAREAASPKTLEIEQRHAEEVRQAVEAVSVESVAKRIKDLDGEVSRTLGQLAEKLTTEVDWLTQLREAVQLERQELEQLHKIDIAATSLEQLFQDYAREQERLGNEIQAKRAEWEQEARTTERERKEAEEALRKQRQRENEDYEYRKQLERKKAQDRYEEEMHLLAKKNEERQAGLERSWAQREAALAEREEELAQLRQQVAEFPQRLTAEKEAALADATRQVTARYEQQILVLQKDAEAERKMAGLQAAGFEDIIKRQTEQIAMLEKAVEEAKRQVQDIALKAIEGASGARALAHVNQIAMEQAKSRPQG